jgi:chromosome segregation ATPase
MSAQPTPPDDFHAALEHMYTDITRYTDKRIEVQNRQILSDHAEIADRMTAVEGHLTNLETRLTAVEERLTIVETRLTAVEERLTIVETRLTTIEDRLIALERSNTELIAMVIALRDSLNGFATDIITQVRDGFAAQAERLNDLTVRVERLEQRDHPKDE